MCNVVKTAVLGLFASAAISSAQVYAQDTNFSYTQLSISAVYTDFDDDIYLAAGSYYEVYDDMGGVGLSGSYQFPNNVIIGASGSYQENSGNRTEINSTQSLWFVGYAFPAANNVDFVVSGGIAYAEAELCEYWYGCYSDDDTGLHISGEVRAWASSWLELNAGISHVNFDDFGSETSLNVGAAGWFDNSSSIFLSLGFSDDANAAALGYRYTF